MGGRDDRKSECVCEFSRVRLKDGGAEPLDFKIRPGELWLIEVPRAGARPDVAGAAVGISQPEEGSVNVLGCNWASASVREGEAVRQRTGRVFDARQGAVWLQNLDIEENLLLPHTITGAEPVEETMERMRIIGGEFGFDEIPKSRPSMTGVAVTQAAQCVRALMRKRLDFLVLEVPTRHAEGAMIRILKRKIVELLEGGCGILWITDESESEEGGGRELAAGSVFYGKSRWTGDRDTVED